MTDAQLAAIAERLDEKSYAAGSVIFEQNKKPESFYLIYEGSVRITRRQDRKEIQLARFVKDDYFGEMGLIAKRVRSGTAVALTDVSLLVMPREDFEKFYKSIPQLRLNFDLALKSRLLARKLQFSWLRPEEVIYFLARKHPIQFYRRVIWPLFGIFVPAFFLYAWITMARTPIVAVAAIVSLVFDALWALWYYIDWENDYYIVTNQRVVWLEKVIGIYDSRQESPLNTVLSVGIEANPLGRALDFGNVIVRTFVGKIPFSHVNHPHQAARMIEEYWQRTREAAVGLEKEAMKDAIRKRLGIPIPPRPKTDNVPAPPPPPKGSKLLRVLGANTLKLRYESGDTVTYRKHWVVL